MHLKMFIGWFVINSKHDILKNQPLLSNTDRNSSIMIQ